MFAGVQESVFEDPVLSQIVPAVVFLFPTVRTRAANDRLREREGLQRRNPEPFMIRAFGMELAATGNGSE
jgi:hypothetical protein